MTKITKTTWIAILLAVTLIIPAIGEESDKPHSPGKLESANAKLSFVVICKPAGRIMYQNRCLNADGYFHVIELESGSHQFEVFRYGPPSDGIRFEYTVRGDEKYNKLILNLSNNEVETDITDLSVFQ
jgi:hypothetical protein